MKSKAVFLDRDGVINQPIVINDHPFPPSMVNGLEIYPDVLESCELLKSLGFLLIIATNQPDVARHTISLPEVEKINKEIMMQLPIDDIMMCCHDNDDNCSCRKPLPGLLLKAGNDWNIDFLDSYMIGDTSKDIEAGYRANCSTILIEKDYYQGEMKYQPDYVALSFFEAVQWIIKK